MSDFWHDIPGMRSRLDRVTSIMKDALSSSRFPLAEAVASLLDANGKMLRPAFLLLSGDFGRNAKSVETLAAAVELLHVATLIHDDVIDCADTRRGVRTLHVAFGPKDAVLAGDWLFSRCFQLAAESSNPDNARLLSALVASICSEEIHQDLENFLWPESVRNYLRKIAGKTAALFSLALRAGAQEAKAPRPVIARLTRIGYDIGMAFQIMDDVLDYESTEGAMGKPVAKDLREGLATLPLILALKSRGADIRPLLGGGPLSGQAIESIVRLVRESGGPAKAQDHARRYTERALGEIAALPAGPARDMLQKVTSKLLVRTR
ncbi:MAG: polyprenyl synthetase family protein [Spirochaetales bacterium]|nr:polyprenyl synthetase family protein [Spirochaetales bacterium]